MVDMTLKPGGGKADKIITDALKAVARQDPNRVKRLAEKWWQLAEDGDSKAYTSLTDRLEGKAPQPIVGGGEDSAPVMLGGKIEIVHVKANES
jgi:hypothetical protein